MSVQFNIGARVRLREGVTKKNSYRVRREESYIVIGESWVEVEPGDDGRDDWTCIPLVKYYPIAVAVEYKRDEILVGYQAFVRYYGDEAEIAFGDIAEIEVIPSEVPA
jgi:hypothetical protein